MKNEIIVHIEGHSELIRDMESGAVINTATSEYDRFVEKRAKDKLMQGKLMDLEYRCANLEKLLREVLGKLS